MAFARKELIQRLDLDIPILHLVAMILQGNVALGRLAEQGPGFELAAGHLLIPFVAALLILDHLHVIEPMFDMAILDDDLGVVPFACRMADILHGWIESIAGAGAGHLAAAIGMALVI